MNKEHLPLNERQLTYLKSIYQYDQLQEADERMRWNRGLHRRPAAEWRWIAYGTATSALRAHLLTLHLVDEGTGSTFESLERRGLILCQYERDAFNLPMLFVQITPKGRKLIRTLTGEVREKPLPPGTLQEWHWRALAVAYAAGSEGVRQEYWGSGRYGGIGWKTWLRLRDYRLAGKEQPLVEEFPVWVRVRRSVFTGQRRPNDYVEREVHEQEHRLRITAFGEQFYCEQWAAYRERYPEVEAPDPRKESEARNEP